MSRAVLQVFENYQASRTTFVQTIAELANRPQNIEALQNAGVMALLRPLLMDTVPSIQQSAALALGRLANYSEALAEAVVMNEVLPQLVYSLSEQNVSFSPLLPRWISYHQMLFRVILSHFPSFSLFHVSCSSSSTALLQENRSFRSQICCQALA